jgi:hypothetical protein
MDRCCGEIVSVESMDRGIFAQIIPQSGETRDSISARSVPHRASGY